MKSILNKCTICFHLRFLFTSISIHYITRTLWRIQRKKNALVVLKNTSNDQRLVGWSDITNFETNVEEEAEMSNVEVFKALQMHMKWGDFLLTFGKGNIGELIIDKK